MLLGEGDQDVRQERLVDLFRVDRSDDGESQLGAERVEDLVRVQEALLDEDVGEAFVALGLAHARLLELLRREPRLLNQDLAELGLDVPPYARRPGLLSAGWSPESRSRRTHRALPLDLLTGRRRDRPI